MNEAKAGVKDVNEIILQGTIVGVYSVGRLTILNLSTGIAGSSTTNKAVVNYPSIIFVGNAAKEVSTYTKGDNVCVKCHAGYRKRKSKDGSVFFQQGLHADSIEYTPKKMSVFGVDSNDSGNYEDPRNEVLLKGTVTSVKSVTDRIRMIHMQTTNESGFKDAVDVVCYQSALLNIADMINKDDVIGVIGTVQTKREPSKTEDGSFVYFQNLVADEVKVIEPSPHKEEYSSTTPADPKEPSPERKKVARANRAEATRSEEVDAAEFKPAKVVRDRGEAMQATKRMPVEPDAEKQTVTRKIRRDENGNPIKKRVLASAKTE